MTGKNAVDYSGGGTSKKVVSVVISAGQTVSDYVALLDFAITGVTRPAGMTGTSLGILESIDNGATYLSVVDQSNTAIALTIDATAKYNHLPPSLTDGLKRIQLVSNATEAADRMLYLTLTRYRN